MATLRAVAVLVTLNLITTLHAEGIQPSVAVYYPGVPWYLRYEVEGVLEEYNNHKPGHSTYTMARSETSGLLISAQISPAGSAKTAAQCRVRQGPRVEDAVRRSRPRQLRQGPGQRALRASPRDPPAGVPGSGAR